MRTVTYNAGAYLVEELLRSGVVARFLHDGGDIILFETWGGSKVSIHLIESQIEQYEIKNTLDHNQAQQVHTLFILWCDRMLPGDGWQVQAPDWMTALYGLYGDRIYAYDIYGAEIFVFPVFFQPIGLGSAREHSADRFVHYGTTVNFGHLVCETDVSAAPYLPGTWRVAGFKSQASGRKVAPSPLQVYYDLLEVELDDDRETIKKAYRLLARRYHPDLNTAADATEKMQAINDAYTRLMTHLDQLEAAEN